VSATKGSRRKESRRPESFHSAANFPCLPFHFREPSLPPSPPALHRGTPRTCTRTIGIRVCSRRRAANGSRAAIDLKGPEAPSFSFSGAGVFSPPALRPYYMLHYFQAIAFPDLAVPMLTRATLMWPFPLHHPLTYCQTLIGRL
jgi:hypothetical protein